MRWARSAQRLGSFRLIVIRQVSTPAWIPLLMIVSVTGLMRMAVRFAMPLRVVVCFPATTIAAVCVRRPVLRPGSVLLHFAVATEVMSMAVALCGGLGRKQRHAALLLQLFALRHLVVVLGAPALGVSNPTTGRRFVHMAEQRQMRVLEAKRALRLFPRCLLRLFSLLPVRRASRRDRECRNDALRQSSAIRAGPCLFGFAYRCQDLKGEIAAEAMALVQRHRCDRN